MKMSYLVPVCFISVLVGQLIPRFIKDGSYVVLAMVSYLLVLLIADAVFNRSKKTPEKS